MKNPGAMNTGAFARNRGFENTPRVPQGLPEININNPDLLRDFPIVAVHWFGLSKEVEHASF